MVRRAAAAALVALGLAGCDEVFGRGEFTPPPDVAIPSPKCTRFEGEELCITFDNAEPDLVRDLSANKNDASMMNVSFDERTPGDRAVRVNRNSEIVIRMERGLDVTSRWTLATWVDIDPLQDTDATILDNHNQYSISVTADHRLVCGQLYVNGTMEASATSQPIAVGTWHHVSCVKRQTALELYLDGDLTNSTTILDSDTVVGNLEPVRIGQDSEPGNTIAAPLTGMIDEVRIYSSALDDVALAALAAP